MLVIPNVQEVAALHAWLEGASPWTLRLFGNDHVPAAGDTVADYTEVSGGGYAAIELATLTADDFFCTPSLGRTSLSSPAAAWTFGDWEELLAASVPVPVTVLGLAVSMATPIAVDTTVEQLFEIGIGFPGEEVTIIQIPQSYRSDTAVGYYPVIHQRPMLPAPRRVEKLTRISARVADSRATVVNYSGVSLLLREALGEPVAWTVTPGAPSVAEAPIQTYVFSGQLNAPGGIYGWYLTDADGALIAAERDFNSNTVPVSLPFRPGLDVGSLSITPRVRLGSVEND